jgi:lipopolysaccharide/colanic/teichoic acid biosynthesis glycosyltransferase
MLARAANVVLSAAGLAIISPLLAVIAAAIVIDSGFPVFFRQPRVGRFGKSFLLIKFRSMRRSVPGSRITGASDRRITRVGRMLRNYKLDELPQLWNVLKGEMSLVGPRPEVAPFVELSDPAWRTLLSVRPGITDLASLLYRDEEKLLAGASDVEAEYREKILPDKLATNLEYLRARNPWTDCKLILLTLWYSLVPVPIDPQRIRKLLYL